jgi:hypothetical protein
MTQQIAEDGWHVIGHVAVDTGHIVIADPCQAHDAADAWDAMVNGDGEWKFPVVTADNWGPGTQAAVFTPTGIGDGLYEVSARYICGDVAEVRIVFIDLDALSGAGGGSMYGPEGPQDLTTGGWSGNGGLPL